MKLFDIFKKKQPDDPSEAVAKKALAELEPNRGLFSATQALLLLSIRETAAVNGIPVKWETSNADLLEISKCVYRAFAIAENQRGERLDDRTLGGLLLYFLTNNEIVPKGFLPEHLRYEAEKYTKSGLRETYTQMAHRTLGPNWDTFPFRHFLIAIEQGH